MSLNNQFVLVVICIFLLYVLMYLHLLPPILIRIPEKDFLKASKTHPRLKTRLNNFHKQMESMDNSEDDWVAIRPEWTTVDRILASRFHI